MEDLIFKKSISFLYKKRIVFLHKKKILEGFHNSFYHALRGAARTILDRGYLWPFVCRLSLHRRIRSYWWRKSSSSGVWSMVCPHLGPLADEGGFSVSFLFFYVVLLYIIWYFVFFHFILIWFLCYLTLLYSPLIYFSRPEDQIRKESRGGDFFGTRRRSSSSIRRRS